MTQRLVSRLRDVRRKYGERRGGDFRNFSLLRTRKLNRARITSRSALSTRASDRRRPRGIWKSVASIFERAATRSFRRTRDLAAERSPANSRARARLRRLITLAIFISNRLRLLVPSSLLRGEIAGDFLVACQVQDSRRQRKPCYLRPRCLNI